MMPTEKFIKIELGIETVRKKPGYQPNPIVEDFWELVVAHRALLLENEELKTKLASPPVVTATDALGVK